MDNAIWHKSSTLKIPTNIGLPLFLHTHQR
ncbi:Mobile element protein [Streptococcus pneumoniae]|nr:Mobile element protein [Streptococcus pneumoniae]